MPDSFPQFSQLPLEIRRFIWRATISPRCLSLFLHDMRKPYHLAEHDTRPYFIPPALQACSESRRELLSHYQLIRFRWSGHSDHQLMYSHAPEQPAIVSGMSYTSILDKLGFHIERDCRCCSEGISWRQFSIRNIPGTDKVHVTATNSRCTCDPVMFTLAGIAAFQRFVLEILPQIQTLELIQAPPSHLLDVNWSKDALVSWAQEHNESPDAAFRMSIRTDEARDVQDTSASIATPKREAGLILPSSQTSRPEIIVTFTSS